MNFKLERLIMIEFLTLAGAVIISQTLPAMKAHAIDVTCIFGCFLAMHLPVLLLKGPAFKIRDEPPDSPYKHYFYGTLFFAIFCGNWMGDVLMKSTKPIM